MIDLTKELEILARGSAQRHPGEAQEIMSRGITAVEKTDILAKAYKTGYKLPEFSLQNATGDTVTTSDLLKKGKLVVTFYRGGWCPYCNIQLRAMQERLPAIHEKGATLVAITPETPDNSLNTLEKNQLDFEILTDTDNTYARELGLVFKMTDELSVLYKKFGIDLEKNQNNTNDELPLAATYVVDTDGKITYSYQAVDYKLRADPEEILKAL